MELANLILEKTEKLYGASKLSPYRESDHDPNQTRCIAFLKRGDVGLVYLPPTKERLRDFNAIKIDIHNGMLGYRVFIVRKDDQETFAKVKTIEQLRNLTGGFGSQWGDYKIFGLNKLPVVGVANTHVLLKMLAGKRFDYFHRGLHEAWVETTSNRNEFPMLVVEKTIALVYDFPVYFMFNKENQALKTRFKKGFEIIKDDKSYQKLFLKNFGDIVKQAQLTKRNLISIEYPIPDGLPPIDTSLWLN